MHCAVPYGGRHPSTFHSPGNCHAVSLSLVCPTVITPLLEQSQCCYLALLFSATRCCLCCIDISRLSAKVTLRCLDWLWCPRRIGHGIVSSHYSHTSAHKGIASVVFRCPQTPLQRQLIGPNTRLLLAAIKARAATSLFTLASARRLHPSVAPLCQLCHSSCLAGQFPGQFQ